MKDEVRDYCWTWPPTDTAIRRATTIQTSSLLSFGRIKSKDVRATICADCSIALEYSGHWESFEARHRQRNSTITLLIGIRSLLKDWMTSSSATNSAISQPIGDVNQNSWLVSVFFYIMMIYRHRLTDYCFHILRDSARSCIFSLCPSKFNSGGYCASYWQHTSMSICDAVVATLARWFRIHVSLWTRFNLFLNCRFEILPTCRFQRFAPWYKILISLVKVTQFSGFARTVIVIDEIVNTRIQVP